MYNFITKEEYKGKNVDRLEGKSKTSEFCTFLQGKNSGLWLKKGTKGIALVAYKTKVFQDKKTKEELKKTIVKSFTVFPKEAWTLNKPDKNNGGNK